MGLTSVGALNVGCGCETSHLVKYVYVSQIGADFPKVFWGEQTKPLTPPRCLSFRGLVDGHFMKLHDPRMKRMNFFVVFFFLFLFSPYDLPSRKRSHIPPWESRKIIDSKVPAGERIC